MAKAWKVKGVKPQKSYRRNASIILSAKIAEVYSWDNYIGDPENIEELHNMRISIKRLRYSMEIFSVNYDQKFNESLQIWVDLQKLLGEIHDCDVGQDVLTDYLKAHKLSRRQCRYSRSQRVNSTISSDPRRKVPRISKTLVIPSKRRFERKSAEDYQKEDMKMMDVFCP